MPWIAIYEGEKKGPRQVPKETDVKCPSCDQRMRVWSKSVDGKARHFSHIRNMGHEHGGGGNNCESVAESDKHIKWKSLAADRLEDIFEDQISECVIEKELNAPKSEKDWRVGDVVLTFTDRDEQLGKGIVVEVQHKNDSKDEKETTADYLNQDYSTVWLYNDDFGSDRCHMTEVDVRERAKNAVWPKFVPKQSSWNTPRYCHRHLRDTKWRNAKKSGLTLTNIPATMPPEWHMDLWRAEAWEKRFSPPEDYTNMWCYSKVPAQIIKDWVLPTQEEYYRSTEWGARFKPAETQKYILQAAIPKVAPSKNTSVSLPPSCVDSLVYSNSDWDSLFIPKASSGYEKGVVKMEIDIAGFLTRQFWESAYLSGVQKSKKEKRELERPMTPFDDVQCHSCGNYNYWKSAGLKCKNCGSVYDWEWNISTGRVSAKSVPGPALNNL